ncbi:MAG: ABC transporter ATP-binding protein [Anaerovoracaceae bacterium]
MLDITDLKVSYGQRVVLDGISLHVAPGEILAIVGHNGAGKTTLCKAIMSLIHCESGTIVMDGKNITNTSTEITTQAGIRMLPSEYRGIFRTRPVKENLTVAAPKEIFRDKAHLQQNIEKCLNTFPDLRSRLDTPAGDLSGGQQQMVAMSIALMADPKLLLLDEPSIGLSPNLVQALLGTVRKLADEQGLGAIVVEQNAKAALDIADHVLALRGGEVIFDGTAKDISVDKLWDLF